LLGRARTTLDTITAGLFGPIERLVRGLEPGISDRSRYGLDARGAIVGGDSPRTVARYGILGALSEVAAARGLTIDGPGGANFE